MPNKLFELRRCSNYRKLNYRESTVTTLVSFIDYFQEKLRTKCFKKSKKPYSWAILDLFCPNLGKNDFFWNKGLCQFLNILIIYHCAEIQKKIMSHSWEKCRINRWMNGKTDGLTDQPTDHPTDWQTNQVTDRLTHRGTDQLTDRPIDRWADRQTWMIL